MTLERGPDQSKGNKKSYKETYNEMEIEAKKLYPDYNFDVYESNKKRDFLIEEELI
jgi:hypothetical protein